VNFLQSMCLNRHSTDVKAMVMSVGVVRRAVNNVNYDIKTNGEALVIDVALDHLSGPFFDVGAFHGDWGSIPTAKGRLTYMFEASPENYDTLVHSVLHENCVTHNVVVGERTHSKVNFYHVEDKPHTSSRYGMFLDKHIPGSKKSHHILPMITGDVFCEGEQIPEIGLLKIDVEGGEMPVIRGFNTMLSTGNIGAIQFEYGLVNIEARTFLKDFYDYLTPRGFLIGKVFPDGVEFKAYAYEDEDFLGPNYLAVHNSQTAFLNAVRVG